MTPRRRSAFSYGRSRFSKFGKPKFTNGEVIGDFTIIRYMGHSDVNKRNNRIMSKPQHWYRCRCLCGTEESRSQQELADKRRQQKCYVCRSTNPKE